MSGSRSELRPPPVAAAPQARRTGPQVPLLVCGALLLAVLAAWAVSARSHQAPAVAAVPLTAHDLHVSPSGNDRDPGTAEAPMRTLGKALQSLGPGETLHVAGGTYHEKLVGLHLRPGTKAAPVRVVAEPGARPVLQGLLWLTSADYWQISGLSVTWSKDGQSDEHMVKFQGGKGWSFTDAELSYARSYAALLVSGDATDFRLANLYVHDTEATNDDNQDHLIYVNNEGGAGIIERCLLVNSPNGRGVKVGPPQKSAKSVGNLEIRFNTFYNNLGPSNIQLSFGAERVRIYRNILVKPSAGKSNVTSFKLDGDRNTVYDNLVYDSASPSPQDESGLVDGGGNVMVDPQFVDPDGGDFHTQNRKAAAYGRYATGPTTSVRPPS